MGVLAILEDDLPRREAMRALLPPGVEVVWFDRAGPMIAWLGEHRRTDSCSRGSGRQRRSVTRTADPGR